MKLFGTDFKDYKVVEKELKSLNGEKTRKIFFIKIARYFFGIKYYFYFYESKIDWLGFENTKKDFSFDSKKSILESYNFFINNPKF